MFAYEQIYTNDHMATAGAEGGWSDSQMKIFLIPGEKCISSTLWGTNYVQATDNLKHIFGFSVQRLLRSYWLIYTLIPLHQHLQPLMYSAGSCTPTNASLLKKKKKKKSKHHWHQHAEHIYRTAAKSFALWWSVINWLDELPNKFKRCLSSQPFLPRNLFPLSPFVFPLSDSPRLRFQHPPIYVPIYIFPEIAIFTSAPWPRLSSSSVCLLRDQLAGPLSTSSSLLLTPSINRCVSTLPGEPSFHYEWASWLEQGSSPGALARDQNSDPGRPVPRLASSSGVAAELPGSPGFQLEERRLEREGGADLDAGRCQKPFSDGLWNWITDYSQMSS